MDQSGKDRSVEDTPKVGLFFFIDDEILFAGCSLDEAEDYGDFLIYPESHYDVWNRQDFPIDYDYYPRGRIVYRKTDDLFIIYYDQCVTDKMHRITSHYAEHNFELALDEHYCCHMCNRDYVD